MDKYLSVITVLGCRLDTAKKGPSTLRQDPCSYQAYLAGVRVVARTTGKFRNTDDLEVHVSLLLHPTALLTTIAISLTTVCAAHFSAVVHVGTNFHIKRLLWVETICDTLSLKGVVHVAEVHFG